MSRTDSNNATAPLAGCYVVSLRPVAEHAAMRRAAAAQGATLLALSPWKLQARTSKATVIALSDALSSAIVIATSPRAVKAANALMALKENRGTQRWFAIGRSTAAALRRAGIDRVISPSRMDSEGMLALPALQEIQGLSVGVLTAPRGRDEVASVLQTRGARIVRADVYERNVVFPSACALTALRNARGCVWLAVSSGAALQHILKSLPPDLVVTLKQARVVAASDRLAALADSLGFKSVVIASDARPQSLLQAAATAMRHGIG